MASFESVKSKAKRQASAEEMRPLGVLGDRRSKNDGSSLKLPNKDKKLERRGEERRGGKMTGNETVSTTKVHVGRQPDGGKNPKSTSSSSSSTRIQLLTENGAGRGRNRGPANDRNEELGLDGEGREEDVTADGGVFILGAIWMGIMALTQVSGRHRYRYGCP